MRVRYGLRIGGQDYTDKLISVSSIDMGVRKLGFGYISDITVECVYDTNLMDAIGQKAQVGMLVEGTSIVYEGEITKVEVQKGKISLSISHISSLTEFPPLPKYYSSATRRAYTVPVIYGTGPIYCECVAIDIEDPSVYPRKYQFLIGDRPVNSPESDVVGTSEIAPGVFVVTSRIKEAQRVGASTHDWFELIESNATDLYRRYRILTKYDVDTKVYRIGAYLDMSIYGGKIQDDGSLSYDLIYPNPNSTAEGVLTDVYDEIKIEHTSTSSFNFGLWTVSLYKNIPLRPDTEVKSVIRIYPVSTPYKAEDIAEDIFLRHGYTVLKGGEFVSTELNFQTTDDWRTILGKVAEQGLLYYIPVGDASYRIINALPQSPPVTVIDASKILPGSVKIEKTPPPFNSLVVIFNQGKEEKVYGSGSPLKRYEAEYIVDQGPSYENVDTFANAYLQYHRKTMRVRFSSPLLPELLTPEVGDVVTFSYPPYQINKNFQIVQKTIRDQTITWVLKEL